MLGVFTLSIVLFSFCITTFGIRWDLFVIVFIAIFLFLFFKKPYYKDFFKKVIAFLAGFSLIFLSYNYKIQSFDKQLNGLKDGFCSLSGTILDILQDGKYVFESQNKKFLYISKNKYEIGDIVFVYGNIKLVNINTNNDFREFNYNKYLFMKGYIGSLYEKNAVLLGKTKSIGFLKSLKKSIKDLVLYAYGENKYSGLILGMTIGDISIIPKSNYENFVNSGIVHIVAVSGGNILMIVLFLNIILFFIPFYIRILITITFVSIYALMCGLESSVFRAYIMGSLMLVALFFGKSISIKRSIFYSICIMLVVNPYYLVYDVGFLLSYTALVGIVLFSKLSDKRFLKNYILPTIGASVGTSPIIMLFFGKINLISIFANFLILFILPFSMIYGIISIVLYKIFNSNIFLDLEKLLLDYIYMVASFFDGFGVYIVSKNVYFKTFFMIFIGFVLWFVVWKIKEKQKTLE